MNKTFTTDEIIRHPGYTDAYKEMSRKEFGAVKWIDVAEHERIVAEIYVNASKQTSDLLRRRVREAIEAEIERHTPYRASTDCVEMKSAREALKILEKRLFGDEKEEK